MLVLARKSGQSIVISDGKTEITVMLIAINGGQAKLGFDAPKNISIVRTELLTKQEGKVDGPKAVAANNA